MLINNEYKVAVKDDEDLSVLIMGINMLLIYFKK